MGSSTVFPWPVRTREEFVKLESVGSLDDETEIVILLAPPKVLSVMLVSIVGDRSFVLLDLEAVEALSDSLDVTALLVLNFCVAVFVVFVVFFTSFFDAFVGSGVGLGVFLGLSLVAFAFVDFGFFEVASFLVAFAFFLVLLGFLDFGFLVFLGGLGSATSPDLAFLGPKARHLEKRGHSLDYICISQNIMSPRENFLT